MKTFMTPAVDVVKFSVEDVITSSGEPVETIDPNDPEYWVWEPPCM